MIIPTVFARTKEEFAERFARLKGVASRLQIDFMDGAFVPATSVALDDVPDLKGEPAEFEAHLMVRDPETWLEGLAAKGFVAAIAHVEALDDAAAFVAHARARGLEPILAINPETNLDVLRPHLDLVSTVLVMGVTPGAEGQSLRRECVTHLHTLSSTEPGLVLQVDGGVNPDTIRLLRGAGATRFNTGSYVSGAEDPSAAVVRLEEAAR